MSRATAWVGWIWFAALLLMASGALNAMTGLVAVLGPDDAYINTGVNLIVIAIDIVVIWALVVHGEEVRDG